MDWTGFKLVVDARFAVHLVDFPLAYEVRRELSSVSTDVNLDEIDCELVFLSRNSTAVDKSENEVVILRRNKEN